ncbi:MAG TPA: hemerythrin domain-containing protein [Casimicrobiaceae bacterium]|nr:hemerythrin domain-containing protein [Casimicrobiaceae bacterium]
MNGLDLLRDDHRRVGALVQRFEALGKRGDGRVKERVARQICAELLLHARLEESILYPLCREALDADSLIDEAEVEHEGVENLIQKLNDMDVDDDRFDATVKVLGEQVQHHVGEEENELFPAIEASGMDLDALGDELATRRQELLDHADTTFGRITLMVKELFSAGERRPT